MAEGPKRLYYTKSKVIILLLRVIVRKPDEISHWRVLHQYLLGRNPVSKHQIQPEYGDEQADAGRDG